jgi:hypothetical protein
VRLSCRPLTPGHLLWELLCQSERNPVVFFDGIKQDHCIAVDDKEGWVERMCIDIAGRAVVDNRSGEPVFEKVYGKVVILLDPQR